MTKTEILEYVKNHPSGKVKLAVADIDGVLRGKYISAEKFNSVIEKGMSFCDVIFGWDSSDVLYEKSSVTGWHSGFPDNPAVLDMNTFRKIPWENNIPFFLGELTDATGGPSPVCPRQLLKKTLKEANEMGLAPTFAQEFEWYNFAETPQSANDKQFRNLTPLTPGMFGYSILRTTLENPFFSDLFDLLKKFNIPIEGLHTETGPGTFEAAISHAGVLESADRAILFKTAVKEIAYKHGIMATFMAKINENLPGCGGHVHQSLWDLEQQKNLFYNESDKMKLSETAKNYIAGQLHCLPYILPMFAPTINSYKRLALSHSASGTTWSPVWKAYGDNNRTCLVRAVAGRLEWRLPDASCNVYAAVAATLLAAKSALLVSALVALLTNATLLAQASYASDRERWAKWAGRRRSWRHGWPEPLSG
jgi:glutamine synthetase